MNDKMKFITLSLVGGIVLSSTPVLAMDYTTQDKILTMTLPDNWRSEEEEIDLNSNVVALFSNGADRIYIETADAGEMPGIVTADPSFPTVFQFVYGTEKEEYVVTAKVSEEQNVKEVYEAVMSIRLNDISDPEDVIANAAGVTAKTESKTTMINGYEVEPMSGGSTYLVNTEEGANLRVAPDENADVSIIMPKGAELVVSGCAIKNGVRSNWWQVSYDGTYGFVMSDLLISKNEVEKKERDAYVPKTFEEIKDQIYCNGTGYDQQGNEINLVYLIDNTILDMTGYPVAVKGDGILEMWDGKIIYEYDPTRYHSYLEACQDRTVSDGSDQESEKTHQAQTESDDGEIYGTLWLDNVENGDGVAIIKRADGYWYDYDGLLYTQDGENLWICENDGTMWTCEN